MRKLAIIPLALAMAGCAATYGPARQAGSAGYDDSMLAPDVALVSFTGNGSTSVTQSYEMAMLRAAEVTTEHSYRYFHIIATNGDVASSTVYMPQTATTRFVGDTATTTISSAIPITGSTPINSMSVRMRNERQDGDFDASAVATRLRAKYEIE